MRLEDDFEDDYDYDDYYDHEMARHNSASTIRYAVIIGSVSVLGILLIVLLLNSGNGQRSGAQVSSQYAGMLSAAEQEHAQNVRLENSVEDLLSGSTLTAEDLDIWDERPGNTASEVEPVGSSSVVEKDDPATDGLHTLIVHDNGTEEWVSINQYLARNDYDYSGLVYQRPLMKYYENNTRVSYVGADISKTQDYVDFLELKRAGIEFVMLRLGQRGYSSGEITLDEYFMDNWKRATEAGLDVGVYFFSQAVTVEEAEEEAQFVIDTLSENKIQYPVVFAMDTIPNEVSRIDSLDKMERTNIAIAFMDKISDNGYFPMIYGDKEWLIQKMSLGSMIGYDVWLSQEMDIPDYPYQFAMWQYTTHGSIAGIAGDANLNICFIDYSVK
ncbi:MAG: hypothetical protein K2K96_03755 [Lachnospiraceae bacterium]|nr:hypothetical protein [Lachnospiraceae bacterium]